MKNLKAAINMIINSFLRGSNKSECATQQPPAPPSDWDRLRDCEIIVEDQSASHQRVTLRYAGEGKTRRMGAPVQIFGLPDSKIEVGIAPNFHNPQEPWVLYVAGLSPTASVFANSKKMFIKREGANRPAYPPRVQPSLA